MSNQIENLSEPNIEKSENVVLISSDPTSELTVSPSVTSLRSTITEGQSAQIAKELSERWLLYETFSYKTIDEPSKILFEFSYPQDMLTHMWGRANNLKILEPYMYFRADLEVMFQVNATRFHIGQLLATTYHAEDYDKFSYMRNNVYCQSVLPHKLITMASGVQAKLYIPFRFPKSYCKTRVHNQDKEVVSRVKVSVLNKLRVSEGLSDTVDITLFVRLINVEVAGMIPCTIARVMPDMFSTIHGMLGVAERAVNLVKSATNRDLPRNPTTEMTVVPRQCQSWAVGKNSIVAPILLRLDNMGICPTTGVNQMSVMDIASIPAFYKTVVWKEIYRRGDPLANIPISPLHYLTRLSNPTTNTLPVYATPPVSGICSMFAYWRGSIDIRFDIIASSFHSGKLLACFIPGVSPNYKVSDFDMANLYTMELDITANLSFSFSVPFIYDREWAPVTPCSVSECFNVVGTGCVQLLVLNRLAVMNAVPSEIDVNIWIGAGQDFEVSIPISPRLGLGWNAKYIDVSHVMAKKGYSKVYVDGWRYYNGGNSPLLRYGPGSDHVAQFVNLQPNVIYSLENKHLLHKLATSYFASIFIPNDSRRYLGCFKTFKECRDYILHRKYNRLYTTSEYVELGETKFDIQQTHVSMVEHHAGDGSKVIQTLSNQDPLAMKVFGESFSDLKDLMRRYTLYHSVSVLVRSQTLFGMSLLRVPITYAGLKLGVSNLDIGNEVAMRQRDGTISLISSCYRYFAGSMRMRIVSYCSDPNLVLGVLHLPEYRGDSESIVKVKASDDNAFIISGYAMHAQSVRMNQVIDLEIPYYNIGPLSLLQRYWDRVDSMSRFVSLGYLDIMCLSPVKDDVVLTVNIYNAAADDTEFTDIIGFPPMVKIDEIPVKPFNERRIITFSEGMLSDNISIMTTDSSEYSVIEAQMFKTLKASNRCLEKAEGGIVDIVDILHNNKQEINNVIEEAPKIMNNVNEITHKINDLLDVESENTTGHKLYERFVDKVTGGVSGLSAIMGQTVHFVADPSITCFGRCLIGFFLTISTKCCKVFNSIMDKMRGLFSNKKFTDALPSIGKYVSKLKGLYLNGRGHKRSYRVHTNLEECNIEIEEAQAEMYDSEEDMADYLGLFVSLACAVLGYKPKKFEAPMDLFRDLVQYTGNTARTSSFILSFFRSHLLVFMKLLQFIKGQIYPQSKYIDIESNDQNIIDWYTRVLKLTNPAYFPIIEKDVNLVEEVFRQELNGRNILIDLAKLDVNCRLYSTLRNLHKTLVELVNNLLHSGTVPASKFEPFCLGIVGSPGIGKSYIHNALVSHMLASVKVNSKGSMVYTRNPMDSYWNGCSTQPVILYDDWLCTKGDYTSKSIGELFSLKTTQPFNPIFADLTEKKRCINPYIVSLIGNDPFPTLTDARDSEAVYRRRDVLVKVELLEEYKGKKVNEIDPEVLQNYGHLTFSFYNKVTDPRSLTTEPMLFPEFKNKIVNIFQDYFYRELKNFNSRFEAQQKLLQDSRDIDVIHQFYDNVADVEQSATGGMIGKLTNMCRSVVRDKPHAEMSEEEVESCCEAEVYFRVEPEIKELHFEPKTVTQAYMQKLTDSSVRSIISVLDEKTESILDYYDKQVEQNPNGKLVPFEEIDETDQKLEEVQEDIKEMRLSWKEKIRKGFSWIKYSVLVPIADFFRKYGLVMLGALAGAIALMKLYTYTTNRDKPNCVPEISSSGDLRIKMAKSSRSRHTLKTNLRNIKFCEAESGGIDTVRSLVRRNGGFFYSNGEYVRFLGICDRYVVSVKHFFEKLSQKKESLMEVVLTGSRVNVRVKDCKYIYMECSSVCVIKLPHNVPLFRDIRKHIANNDYHEAYSPDCRIYEVMRDGGVDVTQVDIEQTYGLRISGSENYSEQLLDVSYTYHNFSGKGRCGCVLLSVAPQTKIIGIHCAGIPKSNIGYSQPISYEMFEKLQGLNVAEPPVEAECFSMPLEGNFLVLGAVCKNLIVHNPTESKLMPLETKGFFSEELTQPAPLCKGDPRVDSQLTPLQLGVAKHGKPPTPFDPVLLKRCAEDLKVKLAAICKPMLATKSSVLTLDQVFTGIAGIDGYHGIKLDTSEGYPLVKERPPTAHNKRWLFQYHLENDGNVLDSISPQLTELMQHNDKLRRQNIIPNTIFIDSLKDTKMEVSKCSVPGKTRVFSESPVEFTIVTKRYFGHFQAALMGHRIESECCVGMRSEGYEWGRLFRYLCSPRSGKFITGDYKAFGDTLDSNVLYAVLEVILFWYECHYSKSENFDQDQKYRRILFEEMLHCSHLAGRNLYKMFCGIPSGYALTVEMNSLVNALYMRLCFCILAKETKYTLANFSQKVKCAFYGDDLLIGVSDDVVDFFNYRTIREVLRQHDISFTPATKDDNDMRPFLSMDEITFLKRGFVTHPYRHGEYLSPLPEISILSCLEWSWKCPDMRAACLNCCRAAIDASHCLGEAYHTRLRDEVIKFWIKRGVDFRCDIWSDVDNRVFQQ